MKIQAIFGRRWLRGLGVVGAAAAGYAFGVSSDRATAQPGTQPAPTPNRQIVAYVYGNVPVTREDLGEFLIARGGYDKLDLLVNKKIIEIEAARRGITVTAVEVEAALSDDLRGLGIMLADFTKHVLPRYNKTLYEWTEDVIKPRLLLGKMCKDRVVVTPEDLRQIFENKYGEKRQAKIICWNKDDERLAQKGWAEARKSDAAFDGVARIQTDPSLAASAGLVAPIGRYPAVEDETCTKKLYSLNVGEMSELFATPAGIMCIKCVAVLLPDAWCRLTDQSLAALRQEKVPETLLAKLTALKDKVLTQTAFAAEIVKVLNTEALKREEAEGYQNLILKHSPTDRAVAFDLMRPAIEREVYDRKMSAEIPKFFTELKKIAQPNVLLKGPPTPKEIGAGAMPEIVPTGGIPPGTPPGPMPRP